MPAALSILTPVVTASPGGEGIATVNVKNTGTVVDQFAINLLGDPSAWARPDPGVVSLFPGAEQQGCGRAPARRPVRPPGAPPPDPFRPRRLTDRFPPMTREASSPSSIPLRSRGLRVVRR